MKIAIFTTTMSFDAPFLAKSRINSTLLEITILGLLIVWVYMYLHSKFCDMLRKPKRSDRSRSTLSYFPSLPIIIIIVVVVNRIICMSSLRFP